MEGDVLSIMPRPIPPTDPSFPQSKQPSSPTSPTPQSPPTAATQKGEIEKWDAWHACAGMSRTEAKRKYIDYLIETMKKYASGTREGKELVGELEFVWDQIKNNTSNSQTGSGSSEDSNGNGGTRPGRGGPRPILGGNTSSGMMHSFNTGQPIGPPGSSRPLRVLSPVSRGDGGDISGREDGEDDSNHNSPIDEDDDDNDDEYDEAPESPNDDPDNTQRPSRRRRNPPHKDKRLTRIERALSQLSTELAALREQLSSSHSFHGSSSFFSSSRRRGSSSPTSLLHYLWRCVKWLLWTTIRQVMFQIFLLGCVVLWGRWRSDRRIEDWVRQRLKEVRERVRDIVGNGNWVKRVVGRRLDL